MAQEEPKPMSPQTIVITGCSSGLGLAFLTYFLSLPIPPHIHAIDISSLPLPHSSSPHITFHHHSVTAPFPPSLIALTTPIHLVLHCAGIRGLVPSVVSSHPGNVAAAETLDVVDHETMMRTFEVNTWGTFSLVRGLLPELRLAAKERDMEGMGPASGPKVVVMASRMGSVQANSMGGGYAYRASKAALNAIIKSFAIDVPEVTFLLLHPGRVETGLVEWKEEGAVSAEESVRDCMLVIDGLESDESGTFTDRFGVIIPW